jgi:hypothetical protein
MQQKPTIIEEIGTVSNQVSLFQETLPNNSISNNSVSESVKCVDNVQMRYKPRSKLFGANVRIVKSRDQKSKFPANQMFPAVFDCNAELDELLKSSSSN